MDKKMYHFIQKSEGDHWWFVGRRLIIQKVIVSFIKIPIKKLLDIGSGFGGMIPLLKKYSESVDSIEPLPEAQDSILKFGARRVFKINNFPEQYPYEHYDLVTLFDVLEHIKDDSKALRVIKNKLLKTSGNIIITVPANKYLWSTHDQLNHHYRRYSRFDLFQLLQTNGYKNIKISYFMSLLFPIAVIYRKFMNKNQSTEEYQMLPPILNLILKIIFSSEALLINLFPYPFGLSLIAIAKK